MANTQRRRFHPYGHKLEGPDFSNAFRVRQLLNNSFLTQLKPAVATDGMVVHWAVLSNHSATDGMTIGLGGELPTDKWKIGTWDNSAGTFTEDTDKANVPLEVTGQNNDGHIILSTEPFSALRYICGTQTVDSGGDYVREFQYYNGAWATLSTLAETTAAPGWEATHELLFEPPADWTTINTDPISSLPSGDWYAVRFRATTEPSTAAIATSVKVLDPLRCRVSHASDTDDVLLVNSERGIPVCDANEALWACVNVASTGHFASIYGEYASDSGTLGSAT